MFAGLPYGLRPYLAGIAASTKNHFLWLHQSGTLPSVLIIGAQKAGTTSLFDMLSRQAGIATSKKKEVHFADRNWWRGRGWYQRCFPKTSRITLEATPNYLFTPFAAERMLQVVPEVRCIAVLRNPVERAFSHYQYECRRGGERYSFEDALAAEEERTGKDWARAQIQPGYWTFALQHHSYLRRGLYASHLARWERLLSKGRLLVVEDRDIYQNTRATLADIQKFIGVKPQSNSYLKHKNAGNYLKTKPRQSATLSRYFAADGQALVARYGARFSWLSNELA